MPETIELKRRMANINNSCKKKGLKEMSEIKVRNDVWLGIGIALGLCALAIGAALLILAI